MSEKKTDSILTRMPYDLKHGVINQFLDIRTNIMEDFKSFYYNKDADKFNGIYFVAAPENNSLAFRGRMAYDLKNIVENEGIEITKDGYNKVTSDIDSTNIGYILEGREAYALQYKKLRIDGKKQIIKGHAIIDVIEKRNVYIIKGNCAVVIIYGNTFYFNDELLKVKHISFYGSCTRFMTENKTTENKTTENTTTLINTDVNHDSIIESMDFSNLEGLNEIYKYSFANIISSEMDYDKISRNIRCLNLTTLTFGKSNNITFGDFCFHMCHKLKEIDFGSGNHIFNQSAFNVCGITTLKLNGDNIFKEASFRRCENLTTLIMKNQKSKIDFGDVFNMCNALKTIDCNNDDINDAFDAFTKTLTPKTSGGLKPSYSKKKKSASSKKGSKKKSSKKKGSKKKGSKKKTSHSKKKST